jgi:hypothetical protein
VFSFLQYNNLGLLIPIILVRTAWIVFRSLWNSWTSGNGWTSGTIVLELVVVVVVFVFVGDSCNAILEFE